MKKPAPHCTSAASEQEKGGKASSSIGTSTAAAGRDQRRLANTRDPPEPPASQLEASEPTRSPTESEKEREAAATRNQRLCPHITRREPATTTAHLNLNVSGAARATTAAASASSSTFRGLDEVSLAAAAAAASATMNRSVRPENVEFTVKVRRRNGKAGYHARVSTEWLMPCLARPPS